MLYIELAPLSFERQMKVNREMSTSPFSLIGKDYIFYYVTFDRLVYPFDYLSFHKEKLVSPGRILYPEKKDRIPNLHRIGFGGYAFANQSTPVQNDALLL
jgi:hypothetical protein